MMHSIFSRETLQLSKPSLRGLVYFFLSIPLVLLAAEIVARSPLGNLLPAPSVKADSFLFDAKVYALEQQVRRDGGLDCLFIGSSVVNSDFDPGIIERIYQEKTGETIHCYNFGIPALTIENATAIADSLITRFHPKVIIYAVIPRDINDTIANLDYLENIDWITFNRGTPSIGGWLVNNSYAWRYFLTWRYWLVTPNRTKMTYETFWLSANGFQPAQGINDPYPENQTMTPKRLTKLWNNPRRSDAVNKFLELQKRGVQIVFIEGPLYREQNADSWQPYEVDYLPPLQRLLENRGIPFWRTDAISVQIPKPHWYDWLHLNSEGAITFSEWLGGQLAENGQLFK
jgi:hypothetical protein